MDIREAHRIFEGAHPSFDRFYGGADGIGLGVGLILQNAAYPLFNAADGEFAVVAGLVYVVSHECDIDPANDRPFNDAALVCPIIPLDAAVARLSAERGEANTRSFLSQVAGRLVDRVAYVPTIPDRLPFGGILYFNNISHTQVRELEAAEVIRCCAVSVFGLRYVDAALHQAILKRPKSDRLPFSEMAGA